VDIWLYLFEILDDFQSVVFFVLSVQKFLEDYLWEVDVEVDWVVEREAEQDAYELEPEGHLVGEAVEPVEAGVVFGHEHVEVGVEDGFCYQGEIFIFNAALVGALLSDKLYSEGAFEVALGLA
jgi:hypothetical protein